MDAVTQDYPLRDASMALAQAKTPFEKLEALNKESRALGIVIRHSGHGHGSPFHYNCEEQLIQMAESHADLYQEFGGDTLAIAIESRVRNPDLFDDDGKPLSDGKKERKLPPPKKEPPKDDPPPKKNARNEPRRGEGAATGLESKKASAYTMRAIQWFWPDRFALGKLGLIGGLPDKGKGLISADIFARCTTAGEWPCKEGTAPTGNVIWFTAEDDIEDTVVPRLVAAGADLNRVHIVGMAKNADGSKRMFNLATDLPLLLAKIEEVGDVVVVIIDPMSAYLGVGKVNNSSTSDVRGVLGPLTKLAEDKRLSIIGIMHFNKKVDVHDAMLRIADSLAYVASARHVYVVVDDAENKDARLFVKAKNNLAPDKHALRYMVGTRMVGHDPDTKAEIWAPHVAWDSKHVEVTAAEAMEAQSGGGEGRAAAREAEDFLKAKLAHGPVLKQEIEEEAKALDISTTGALKRAKKKLGIKPYKEKGKPDGNWFWELPATTSHHNDA